MAMIAMTTSSSISVKPERGDLLQSLHMTILRCRNPAHGARSDPRSHPQQTHRREACPEMSRPSLHRAMLLARLPRLVRRESREPIPRTTSGQVFWLPDRSTDRAFPSILAQWRVRRSSPDTAAGPRRIRTVFPILLQATRLQAPMSDGMLSTARQVFHPVAFSTG